MDASRGLRGSNRKRAGRLLEDYYSQMRINLAIRTPDKNMAAALEKGMEPAKVLDFFGKITEIAGRNAGSAYEIVPYTLALGLSSDQILEIFGQISEYAGPAEAKLAYQSLSTILQENERIQHLLTPDEITTLFGKIPAIVKSNTDAAFKAVLATLEAGLSPKEVLTLFGKISENAGLDTFEELPSVIKRGRVAKSDFKEPQGLQDKIWGALIDEGYIDKYGFIQPRFNVTEANFALLLIISDQEQAKIFAVVKKAQTPTNKLTPEEIADLFERVTIIAGKHTTLAYKCIADALEAGLSVEQTLDVLMKISRHDREYATSDYKELPGALKKAKAKLEADKMAELFGGIPKIARKFTNLAYKNTPDCLDADLSVEQILELFTKLRRRKGRNVHVAYQALPKALKKLKTALEPEQTLKVDDIVKEATKKS